VDDARLAGLRVGVTGARKGGELAAALERRGADVLLGPTIEPDVPAPDDELLPQLDALLAAVPDRFVANTGVGMRLLGDLADRSGRGAALRALVRDAHVVARGAKAVGGLRSLGLAPDDVAPEESDASVVALLRDRIRPGDVVGLQLSGRTSRVYAELEQRGATLVPVRPYRVGLPADAAPARGLVKAAVAGDLDVVVCTSAIAVDNLVAIAAGAGLRDELVGAFLGSVAAASIGAVTSEAFAAAGVPVTVQPERHRTGDLLRALTTWWAGRAD
jgi:uroporphyrinogen-III synthase